jgi:hypothetical protein
MKLTDFTRLKKLMMMTMSGADQEVLTAIRKANELLVTEKVDWDRVLSRMVSLEVEDGAAYDHAPRGVTPRGVTQDAVWMEGQTRRVEAAFSAVWADEPRGSFRQFIMNLQKQWNERHRLTENQRSALFDAAAQARSRGHR